MINWMYLPKNQHRDDVSVHVVQAFENIAVKVDSYSHQLKSDEVLSVVRPGLGQIGFIVEKSKKSEDLVAVPVLYGVNGKIEKSFEADGYLAKAGYVIEVEAGRAVVNYQFLKDFLKLAQWLVWISFASLYEINTVILTILSEYANSLNLYMPAIVLEYHFLGY